MNKKPILWIVATCIIIMSNIVMITILNNGEEINSNLFVIIVTVFITIRYAINYEKISKRDIIPERWGIWALAACSIVRLANRIDGLYISDRINFGFLIFFIGVGIVFLGVAIGRIYKKGKNNSK